MKTDPEAELMTDPEVTALIRMAPGTLANWRSTQTHTIPFVRIGARVRYRRRDVEAWIEQHLVVPPDAVTMEGM